MQKMYHSLLVKHNGSWGVHFGDFDKATVDQERADLHEGSEEVKMKDMKIITTDGTQAAINSAVNKLNGTKEEPKRSGYRAHVLDVFDMPNKGTATACRARYIEVDKKPTWLVYGDDFDTCGAVQQVKKGKTIEYVASARGEEIESFGSLTAAILATLDDGSKKTFLGGIDMDDYLNIFAP